MEINPHIFRQFSIRGIADQDLNDEAVTQIGNAIGRFFRSREQHMLVIGRDFRASSDRIRQALTTGLLAAGIHLTDIGAVPTPVLNFTTDHQGAHGGIMITASHNPPSHNGLKIRAEQTLRGDELQEILHLAQSQQTAPGPTGTLRQIDPLPAYLSRLKSQSIWLRNQEQAAPGPRPHQYKIVVDGGSGTNGPVVSSLLSDLGWQVIDLFCDPDGSFPNRSPDPTAPGATDALSHAVLANGANLGVAYDGDGDRLVVVDDQGKTILGDQLLMLFARHRLRKSPAKIVYEILCTQALADDVIAHGGTPIMTPSGYAFIHQAMRETKAAIGGELSGHFFFNEPAFQFDDAILATIKLLNIIADDPEPLSQLATDLPAYYSSPEFRLKCPDEAKSWVVDRIKTKYRQAYHVEEIDGARIHFPGGWALVRQSNTQPVLSMRFEAADAGRLKQIQTEIQSLVESYIRQTTTE